MRPREWASVVLPGPRGSTDKQEPRECHRKQVAISRLPRSAGYAAQCSSFSDGPKHTCDAPWGEP
jgi:hypothetical protein